MILVIGEILFDVFPNYRRLGGAPFNFAHHLKHFGFNVRFISKIGIDDAGKEILHKLELARFDLNDIQLDEVHPTGSVKVRLDKSGVPQFDIISDVAYDYIEFIPEYHSTLINEARIIYFGSLVQRSEAGCENLRAFISRKSSGTLNFFDINLRPGCYNNAIIEKSLLKTDILKLNTDELEELKQMLSLKSNNDEFINQLMEAHSIRTVSLTKGEAGSELFTDQGCFSSNPAEPIAVVDSVGAGDAYSAILVAGLLEKWRPEEILERASLFASRVCEIKGAIPDSASFYEPFKALFEDN
ncbi:MAG: carbohydrate kinase [Desulfobacterales bacterium]|nr:carbohydrate kinase [Deltaproteobacteria bacterium]